MHAPTSGSPTTSFNAFVTDPSLNFQGTTSLSRPMKVTVSCIITGSACVTVLVSVFAVLAAI